MTNFQPNKVVNSIFNFRLYLNSHLYFYIFHILKYILLYSTSFLVFQIMHIFLFSNHCISFGYPKGVYKNYITLFRTLAEYLFTYVL